MRITYVLKIHCFNSFLLEAIPQDIQFRIFSKFIFGNIFIVAICCFETGLPYKQINGHVALY